MAREALIRLYDMGPSHPLLDAPAAAPGVQDPAPALPRFEAAVGPRAESFVELRRSGALLGRCGINRQGPGTVGGCELTAAVAPADRAQVHWLLIHLALERLQWLGYAYALLEIGEHADRFPPELRQASWWIPDSTRLTSAVARDDKSLEWADLFIDFRTWQPSSTPVSLTVNGRDLWVRRPEAGEQLLIVDWLRETFGGGWASEIHRSFSRDPISSVIVVDRDKELPPKDRLLGFLAYDTARLGMLSTIALVPEARGRDLSLATVLIEECLREARASGMTYAVLGGVGHARVAALRAFSALWTIPGSCPGIFGRGVRN
ncbi:GNAT family N-acetyltransferase [Streptomyces sp. NBC_00083]|uniref:GNAT family N-acetyltransferase n=1 Tax=Streptomyces sp. NBC_00083 TaxID=2975647 RepID=UPI00225C1191|nr:GNAT family N-acetyltransferase [Streptomyces sp. NBC_00083]MCX5387345.1 GNAT family N-acetyltransferase [Streptomyces sp. NBC_00083]